MVNIFERRTVPFLSGIVVAWLAAAPALGAGATAKAKFDLVTHSSPDTKSKVVAHIKAGTKVVIVKRSGEWVLIHSQRHHKQSWTSATLLDLGNAASATAEPTATFSLAPATRTTTPASQAAARASHAGPTPTAAAAPAQPGATLAPTKNVRGDAWLARSTRKKPGSGSEALTTGSESFVSSEATAESLITRRAQARTPVITKSREPVLAQPFTLTHKHGFVAWASAGFAQLRQRLASNGTGPLANYDLSTQAVSVAATLGYRGAYGSLLRFGVDGSYSFAGATQVGFTRADGAQAHLPIAVHNILATVSAGLHTSRAGGVDLSLVVGGEFDINAVNGDIGVNLPSDYVLSLVTGLALAAPHLLIAGSRPIGLRGYALALAPGSRNQNLSDGRDNGTYGFRAGAGLEFGLVGGQAGVLTAVVDYNFMLSVTNYVGASRFDPTATVSNYGTLAHHVRGGLECRY